MLKNYMEAIFREETDWAYIISTEPIPATDSALLDKALYILTAQLGPDANFMIYIGEPILITGKLIDTETEDGIYIVPQHLFPLIEREEINIVSKRIYAKILDITCKETQGNPHESENKIEALFEDNLIIGLVQRNA